MEFLGFVLVHATGRPAPERGPERSPGTPSRPEAHGTPAPLLHLPLVTQCRANSQTNLARSISPFLTGDAVTLFPARCASIRGLEPGVLPSRHPHCGPGHDKEEESHDHV